MNTAIQQRVINSNSIFDRTFLESKNFFIYSYDQPPSMSWVNHIDMDKTVQYLKDKYHASIKHIYQYSEWIKKRKRVEIYRTVIVLEESFMIEVLFDYCQILYLHKDHGRAGELLREVCRFKKKEKKSDFSVGFITKDNDGMQLKTMEVKKTRLDLDLYYEDDFRDVDILIRKRLNKKEDKGIILLHGLPGAGKTTYLRHLVGSIRKQVMFLPPAAADHITEPQFMDLLMDNPDSVLVIEDAENIIMDRKINGSSSVSDLLNISDGLLSDFLHLQIICTFNHPLSMVDAALLRKGRLIAQYEFGRLSVKKAQRLSDKLGFNTPITRPMTIAEITHQGEKEHALIQRVHVLGFRQHA